MTDCEVLRLHYAYTLQAWYDRAVANKDKIVAMYDEKFFRMWTFYLAGLVRQLPLWRDGQLSAAIRAQPARAADHARLHAGGRAADRARRSEIVALFRVTAASPAGGAQR